MKVGEIVETSTTRYTAQAYEYDIAPAFGSFVQTTSGSDTVVGVVTEVTTSTLDESRKPMALGDTKSSLEDTLASHPQLSKLVHTYFTVRITHVNGTDTAPDKPPHLHEGVTTISDSDTKKLIESPDYLARLLDTSDDVLEKHLGYIASLDEKALISASERISRLLKDDYGRLQRVLKQSSL